MPPSIDCRRMLAASEERLASAQRRIQELEQAGQAAGAEREALAQHLAGLEAEHGALRGEYHAVTDDLTTLVKENQVGCRRGSVGHRRGGGSGSGSGSKSRSGSGEGGPCQWTQRSDTAGELCYALRRR